MKKTAIILFNLGGPDRPEAVKPFLFNLFNDPAIIGAPTPIRWLLAKFISGKRESEAQEIYSHIGDRSPILPLTEEQAAALDQELENWRTVELESIGNDGEGQSNDESEASKPSLQSPTGVRPIEKDSNPFQGQSEYKSFISMRYWHPFAEETVQQVKEYAPDQVILLPLYPQFSTTTSGSSIKDWHVQAKKAGLDIPTKTVCCYPTQKDFIAAHAQLIKKYYNTASEHGTPRILFSAHGLPKKIIEKGDPYQWQVEQTAKAVVKELENLGIGGFEGQSSNEGEQGGEPSLVADLSSEAPVYRSFSEGRLANEEGVRLIAKVSKLSQGQSINYTICYQSKVGPLEWIGPSTDAEIMRAGEEGVPILIVPIAFVSEHSETLVELDIEYKELAEEHNVPAYIRVPALGTHPGFIKALAKLCRDVVKKPDGHYAPHSGVRICPVECGECVCRL